MDPAFEERAAHVEVHLVVVVVTKRVGVRWRWARGVTMDPRQGHDAVRIGRPGQVRRRSFPDGTRGHQDNNRCSQPV
jgi:hypothetical protein